MQFLKILFWIVLTVLVVLFTSANWTAVEVKLWGGLIADAKLPVLLLLAFLLGFLPTLIVYRAKIWSLKRRMEPLERNSAQVPAVPAAAVSPLANEERLATDTKVWPQA